ncbi:PhzF family phenazine biosynthesis protein [Aneurinibacillus aneurinilyticus]|uniref:PhzF family phenazine biosynthesis protein n=1 Tax=Aneurinibacillus aneurinilyticus TaxID=1391 RepID=A0A848CWU4_ANEAE|nr:PhzF family phenazine biosynthesis isomerase [Aneurinibacillus aneurinilyticus]MCI1693190.1 PhzF family phenazine biosynthesis isomerase [Aneurinibacillus aneurinilyticus]MED0671220.1 PhzF family phenazine biosynthesis isomerase [Aneurinibacillus aneurinilyticus]NME99945.1 PhzF family phenazine biosynthesis protein [Aneurinibacillus aneurinilyticus]
MEIYVYTLHAFAKEKHGGNPAGVVLHADFMTEKEMQKVAHMIGFSETAFIQKSSQADYALRFFTPNSEVDLCGHATIATFHLMLSQNAIRCGTYTLETKNNAIARCRNFAPLVDIPEESATGTATGALGCYLYKYGKLTDKSGHDLIFEQGYTMQQPSEIKVRLCVDANEQIRKVEVGGIAVNTGMRKVCYTHAY